MIHKCEICGKEHDLFELRIEVNETDDGIEFSRYVCGTCWEVIAAIARRVVKSILQNP